MQLLVTLIFMVVTPFAGAAQKPDNAEAVAMLDRAREAVNIRGQGPLTLKADVTYTYDGRTYAGEYALHWVSTDKWRETIVVGDYRELRIGQAGEVWQHSNRPQYRFIGIHIRSLVGFDADLRLKPLEDIKSVAEKKRDGKKHTCIKFRSAGVRGREVCLVRDSDATISGESQTLSDYRPVGKRVFPFSLTEKSLLDLRIREITPGVELEESLFAIPALADRKPGCYLPTAPQIVERVTPTYPAIAKQSRISGQAAMFVTIGPDGKVLAVEYASGHRAFTDAVEQAVRRSKFLPANCEGAPVSYTTLFVSNFTMGM